MNAARFYKTTLSTGVVYGMASASLVNMGQVEFVSGLEYNAIRAARRWLLTEPGYAAADKQFHVELVHAGLVPDTKDILGIVCTGEDDYRVQVVTATHIFTLDTKGGGVKTDPMPQPA